MRLYYILFLFVFYTIQVKAQQSYFDHFTVESGITNNQVFNIIQDDLGYVWIGSLNGLNRYNGYEFERFLPSGNKPGFLKGNNIQHLSKGKEGNIWAVTRNGALNFYNAKTEKFYQFPDSIFPFRQTSIHNIIEDINGNIRFLSNEKFYHLDITNQKVTAILPNLRIKKQFEYSKDITWLITTKGILSYDTRSEKQTTIRETLSNLEKVISITRDPLFEIYILTTQGIYHLDQEYNNLNRIVDFDNFSDYFRNKNQFLQLACDGNNYWVKYGAKLFRFYKNNSNHVIEEMQDIPLNKSAFHGKQVNNLLVDNDRNTWISTNKNGINLYNQQKNQFEHYYPYNLTSGNRNLNPVRALCKAKDGKIWVGFENSGLGYYDGEKAGFHSFDLKGRNIGSARVMIEDSKNNLWIGTQRGVYWLDIKSNKLLSLKEKLNNDWPHNSWVLKEDRKGQIWVGGSKLGVINLKDSTIRYPFPEDQRNGIRDIQFDKDHVWLASDGRGVFKIDLNTQHQENFTSSDNIERSLCDNKTYCICVQKDYVWTGTNSGLSRINKHTGEITNYFEKDGLSNDVIYGIYSDEKNNLWISTAKGITLRNNKTKRFTRYLQKRFFLDDAHHKSRDKKIYFGGYNGFVAFDPDKITPASSGQRPILKEMYLMGQKVQVNGQDKPILHQALSHTKEIILDHTQNNFSFKINAIPVTSSGLVSFMYKLDGYQKKWVHTQHNDNSAEFTQVPPGEYTLRVRSSNTDGIWSPDERKLKIVITPPFWKTMWFNGFVILLIALAVFILVKARERNIKRSNIQLQTEVDAKTAELRKQNAEIIKQKDEIEKMSELVHQADQAKLRFFTNVSHELKTPLTLIIGHLDMIKQANQNSRSTSFQTVRRNALKLLGLVNDIVDFRKASQGELQLAVKKYNCISGITTIVDDFKATAALKRIEINFLPPQNEIFLWLDQGKFEKILNNLITNAIKYTPRDGSILLSIEENEKNVNIHIKDTGIGIQAKDQDKIFERFYRSSASNGEIGHGIGLALVKSLVELHQGTITVESEKDKGSCFSVQFLKGKDHLPQESFIQADQAVNSRTEKNEIAPTIKKSPVSLIKSGVPSLLIVEDNPELLAFMCDLLTENYSIETADNGVEALEKLENYQADLIISDIMMPKMDGITLCKNLKQDIRYSHIPMILLTAKSDIETRIEGFQLGIDDYIEKPFNPQLLKVRITALLTNREKVKSELLKGNLTVTDDNMMQSPDKAFLEKVWKIIGDHFHKVDFSVDFLGKEVGMSRATFFRKFKGLTGQSPIEFIKTYRIQKAGALIKAGHNSISEICTMVGYRSPSQFRKAFKEEFNMSPSEYMNHVGK